LHLKIRDEKGLTFKLSNIKVDETIKVICAILQTKNIKKQKTKNNKNRNNS